MGSVEPGETDRQCRKRARSDEPPFQHGDTTYEGWSAVSKRTCAAAEPPGEEQQLRLLEDLYGLDSTQDGSFLESGAQEELVSEMMKSLEKVIGAPEETSSLEPNLDNSSQLLYRSLSQKIQSNPQSSPSTVLDSGVDFSSGTSDTGFVHVREGSDSSESEVDIKFLLEASDDELGIPPSPEAEQVTGNFVQDASWLDGSYPELYDEANIQLITGVEDETSRLADGRQGWAGILDGFVDVEMPISAEREYCEFSVF